MGCNGKCKCACARVDDVGFEVVALPKMSDDDIKNLVDQYPNHGNDESLLKIINIVNYGPDYHRSLDGLNNLIKYWKVDKDKIIERLNSYGDLIQNKDAVMMMIDKYIK